MEEFFKIISNFGFPIAMTAYLLLRYEKKLDVLEETNKEKVNIINALVAEVKELKEKVEELQNIIINYKKRR